MKIAVIGAGPSGLVTLKYLVTASSYFSNAPFEVQLFESEARIGGTFRHRTYEDAELVSSRQLTTFSDLRLPDDMPDFLTADQYCDYLEQYCSHFQLWPFIRLSTEVLRVSRGAKSGHVITYKEAHGNIKEWGCDAVAICSGLHVTPNIPTVKGVENVPAVLHSSEFKAREDFGVNKQVVILGSGETGMDISYLAVTGPTKSVTLCHRDGFLAAPKRVPDPVILGLKNSGYPTKLNVPVDVSSASLFDTAYVHPWLERSPLLWEYYDVFIKSTLWLVSGTKHGLDQWIGGISEERYHASKIFFNKSNRAIPYISAPYRKSSLLQRIRSKIIQTPLVATSDRIIDLAPWPEKIDSDGRMWFVENKRAEAETMRKKVVKPDVLIFATGYTQRFPFLDATYPTPDTADVRRVWKSGDNTVAFLGFIRPSFGAIPPLAEFQAQLWVLSLLGRVPNALAYEDSYALRVSSRNRIQYGVDHESYAYQLALDIGSAPSFLQVLSFGWKVTLVWALGANFNTKFRLVGPWKQKDAARLMQTEFWNTITRRGGFFGHITLSGLPMLVFGSISFLCYILSVILEIGIWVRGKTRKAFSID